MNPFDAKPTVAQDFYNNYFEPTRKESPGLPIPVVLERSLEQYPLKIKMSLETLKRYRRQR